MAPRGDQGLGAGQETASGEGTERRESPRQVEDQPQPGGGQGMEDRGPAPAPTGRRTSPNQAEDGGWRTEDQPQPSCGPVVVEGARHAAAREGPGHLHTSEAWTPCTVPTVLCGSPGATHPLPQLSQETVPAGFCPFPVDTLAGPRAQKAGRGRLQGDRAGGTGGHSASPAGMHHRVQTLTPTQEPASCPPAQAAALLGRGQ